MAKPKKTSAPKEKVKREKPLTPQEEMAVLAHIHRGLPKYKAMLEAGYSLSYAKSPAGVAFWRKPRIANAIAAEQAKITEKYRLDDQWIIKRLMIVADTSLGDILLKLEKNNNDLEALTPEERYALSEMVTENFKIGRGDDAVDAVRRKLKISDKNTALVTLARIRGMFQDKVVVEQGRSLAERLQAGRLRMNRINALPGQREQDEGEDE